MKLYYAKGACSLVVRIVINELQISCQFEAVNLKTKVTEHGADYLQVNPKGAVPTLDIENYGILTENAVILQFLADNSHAKSLLPPVGDFNRYHVLELLNFITTELHKTLGWLFNDKVANDFREQVAKPIIMTKLKILEDKLGSNPYLLGETFTLPDAYLFVMLNWCKLFKIDLIHLPKLDQFHTRLKQRESIKQSLQEEGIYKE